MEFINIGPVYIRGWVGDARVWGGWWQSLNKEEIRHKANSPLQGLDRRAPTVGALSGPHMQLGALP